MSIIEKGGKVYKINKILFYYRQRKDSMARKITSEITKQLKKQIALNHLEFYAKNLGDPLSLSDQIKDLERQKLLLENSLAYRTGNVLIKPLKAIRALLAPRPFL